MSLPVSFSNKEDYFERALKFFEEIQFLYNFPNTNILTENVLHLIDVSDLDLNLLDENFEQVVMESSFVKTMFARIDELTVLHEKIDLQDNKDLINGVPLGPKKKHEIYHLAQIVEDICLDTSCRAVVDFGSGLGYLDQQIFQKSRFSVLGLECNEQCLKGALKRQLKYHRESMKHVRYVKHQIRESSDLSICHMLQDFFPDHGNFCIVGLHACADLTIDAVNIFLKMEQAKALVLMPCCYHKMSRSHQTDVDECFGKGQRFCNFPLSSTLRVMLEECSADAYLRVPLLRLAAQPPSVNEELSLLVFRLLSRAVLQVYVEQNNQVLVKKKRKAVSCKTIDKDFESYLLQATSDGYSLKCNGLCIQSASEIKVNIHEKINQMITNSERQCSCQLSFDLDSLRQLWQHHSDSVTVKRAAIFVLLQRHLQPVFENFILFDRIVYLKERGVSNCSFKKIVNETISPRCLALVATK